MVSEKVTVINEQGLHMRTGFYTKYSCVGTSLIRNAPPAGFVLF